MTDDSYLLSGASAAFVLAAAAYLRADGVPAADAFDRGLALWRQHIDLGNDSWLPSELRAAVLDLTAD